MTGPGAGELRDTFADLHVHLGKAGGHWIKVSASADLTVPNVLEECLRRKGIAIVGVVDLHSPPALEEVEDLLRQGRLTEPTGGGLLFRAGEVGEVGDRQELLFLPGTEVETSDRSPGGRSLRSHHLVFLPTRARLRAFAARLARYVTNPVLSTQRSRLTALELLDLAGEFEAIFIPAHIFTPHRGVLGAVAPTLGEVFGDTTGIAAVELGLSADTAMAGRLSELDAFTFIANSDAHSLATMAREYNRLLVGGLSFAEVRAALAGEAGRKVVANYGLDPRLGKYHRTACQVCAHIATASPPVTHCEECGSVKVTMGVRDRLEVIADRPEDAAATATAGSGRPPYVYQVPLRDMPGVGPQTFRRMLAAFGTEMNILHRAGKDDLVSVAGPQVAALIMAVRQGVAEVEAGGGGRYGRIRPIPRE